MGLTGNYGLGGVAVVVNNDINKSRDGRVGVAVSVCLAEIMFETGWFGYRCVHASSVEKGVN